MDDKQRNNKPYTVYMSYGFQLLGGVAAGIWIGRWLDKKYSPHTPMFIWILPLVILIALLYQLVKEFSKKE